MSETQTAARGRFVESAARIVGNLGGYRRFRRVASTKDPRRGSQTFAVVGEPVEARCNPFSQERKKAGGVRELVECISVEREPFAAHGGLSDLWEVQLDEPAGWTALGNVVSSRDRTTWGADLLPLAEAPS